LAGPNRPTRSVSAATTNRQEALGFPIMTAAIACIGLRPEMDAINLRLLSIVSEIGHSPTYLCATMDDRPARRRLSKKTARTSTIENQVWRHGCGVIVGAIEQYDTAE
jgi:hypothetical protein